jgi:RNA polymerase sigma-70 factor (ECF subfamily)
MSEEKSVEEDRDLIQRMASQDAVALEFFYQRYSGLAFGLILRIVGNRADAEDVLMDVFWQVWRQSHRYDASRGKPLAWLLTIARTRAIDCIRSNSRHQVKDDQFESQSGVTPSLPVTDSLISGDVRNAVQKALGALSEQQRVHLELAYFQGMSHTEIAAALGQPLGTVKDRIRTGMVHLRKALKPYL